MKKIARGFSKNGTSKMQKLQQRAYVVYEKHISYK